MLGLAIDLAIAEAHGGTVRLARTPARGRFELLLSIGRGLDAAAGAAVVYHDGAGRRSACETT